MTKLVGTELIGFTVTDGKNTGRVVDYDDGIYLVSFREYDEFRQFTRKQIEEVYIRR